MRKDELIRIRFAVVVALAWVAAGAQSAPAQEKGPIAVHQQDEASKNSIPDTKDFGALLSRIVEDGKVDYARVEKERKVLDRYLTGVANADVAKVNKRQIRNLPDSSFLIRDLSAGARGRRRRL